MPNPFTRFLRSLRGVTHQSEIEWFITKWDICEVIVIRVYKRKSATTEESTLYAQLREELLATYKVKWQTRFAPHWVETLEAGKAPKSDPFLRLLAPTTAEGFINNWAAMQALPAARETLNRYILAL